MSRRRVNLRREREHLARAFGAIVIAVAPAATIVQACNSVAGTSLDLDARADGSNPPSEASGDSASIESGVACSISVAYYDSGNYYDAEGGGVDVGCIYDLPCGLPPTVVAIGCQAFLGDPASAPDAYVPLGCTIPEGVGCTDGSFTPGEGGALGLICNDCLAGGGRRPRGVARTRRVDAKSGPGKYFAIMAHEEAVSVYAFVRLHEELTRFGAPCSLARAALRATHEEMKHANEMRRWARAFGGASPRARVRKWRERSLEAMAMENAVEGCVNETFGALLMTWQSEHAATEELRASFAQIARDEVGHAALAWSVAAWAEARLDVRANVRVRRARTRAIQKIVRSPKVLENKAIDRCVGWPNEAERAELARRMIAMLGLAS